MSERGAFVGGLIVPGLPHPLLVPERNPGWMRIRRAFEAAREDIARWNADLLVIYSTMWPSIIGHQVQADPEPEWVHVDETFHELGSIPYRFRIDADFAHLLVDCARARGLHARPVAYHGFPIDTGSVVALKLLNPDNAVPACIVSSNMYADRAETIVLGKAVRDAVEQSGRRVVAIVVSTLSNRLFTRFIAPEEDRIHSQKDDEWNRKILEFLADGRLEDVAQLSREIHQQVRVKKVIRFKPMWWLSGAMGRHNRYRGQVHGYAPIHGTGAAVVALEPDRTSVGDKEYDEEDVEFWRGDRDVLDTGGPAGAPRAAGAQSAGGAPMWPPRAAAAGTPAAGTAAAPLPEGSISPVGADAPADQGGATHAGSGRPDTGERVEQVMAPGAPRPVGAYPHARRVGDLLLLSGVGPRRPGSDEVPGGPVRDAEGRPLPYDIRAQTEAVIDNVRAILEAAGSSLEKVVDVTVFLIDMDRDFPGFNEVWARHFGAIRPARTTVAVRALPTPIAVEFKVMARA